MTHDEWRERLALSTYGELGDGEQVELQAHLAGCGECRGFAEQLERGLGSLARSATPPAFGEEWLVRVREAAAREALRPRRLGRGFVLGLAAGAAAGVLATTLATLAWRAPEPSSGAPAHEAVFASAFERSTPPPQARGGGWAQLGRYRRR